MRQPVRRDRFADALHTLVQGWGENSQLGAQWAELAAPLRAGSRPLAAVVPRLLAAEPRLARDPLLWPYLDAAAFAVETGGTDS